MTLLTDIQAVADRYAAARTGYDAVHARYSLSRKD